MIKFTSLLTFGVILLVHSTSGLNILMAITFQGYSHVTFMNRIADVLIDGGHNLTILDMPVSPFIKITGNTRAAKVIHYQTKNVDYGYYTNMSSVADAFLPNRKPGRDIPNLYKQRYLVCAEMVRDDALMRELNSTKYDVALAEIIEICHEGFFEVLGIKNVIHTSAIVMYSNVYDTHGIPDIPSFMPNMMIPVGARMTYSERVWNSYYSYRSNRLQGKLNDNMNQLFRAKYGADFPNLVELRRKRAGFVFMNNNIHLDFPNLITSKVKYIGGLESKQQYAPISEELKAAIGKYKGFVIFSFGSIMRTAAIPELVKKNVVAAFKQFPEYAFLWKFDKAAVANWNFAEGATNLYFEEWLPQNALLSHPKCKAFISHVGYNSFQESIQAGVPVIAVPLFADQMHQGAVVAAKKLGILLGREKFDQVHLVEALKELLTDEPSNYHIQARKFAARIRDELKLNPPEAVILNHVEFTAKHGSMPDMNLSSIDLPFYQLYLLDILGVVLVAVLTVLAIIVVIVKSIFKTLFSKKPPKQKSQ